MQGTQPPADKVFDLIVIGGGITGAGVVRDAALRGLSCLLLEKNDFASGVTSKTTRLIHGGLRYLANFELGLVAESLRERSILSRMAPYLVRPIPIVLPIYQGDQHGRGAVSLGIRLYDLLSHEPDIPHYFTSGRDRTLGFESHLNQEGLVGSALFYDHQIMMPERLVIENILSARVAGAVVLNHTKAERIEETGSGLEITARAVPDNGKTKFRAKVLINASGPWIDKVRETGGINSTRIIHPTKGIHLVMPKLSGQALFIPSRDDRVFFVVPFGQYSLIGTTDTNYSADLNDVHANGDDIDYLLKESRRVLPGLNLARESILWTYAGVRPLAYSGSSESRISRKHRVIKEGRTGRIITVAGGKMTTYRKMAKDAVDAACSVLRWKASCITDRTSFPGGLPLSYEDYLKEAVPDLASRFRIAQETVQHLISLYGSRTKQVLDLVQAEPSLGRRISPASRDIYAQVVYSISEEGGRTLSDIVLRRMHMGLTETRGADKIGEIAEAATGMLKWSKEESKEQIRNYREEISRDVECLGLNREIRDAGN